MHSGPRLAATALFVLIALGSHAALYRWLRRCVLPGARWRPVLLAALGLLCALPAARLLSPDRDDALRALARVGMLWQLLVYSFAAAALAGWALARAARAASPPAGAETAPPAPRDPDAPAPPERPADPGRRLALERIGGASVLAAAGGVIGWGAVIGRYDLQIEQVAFRLARLPRALDGFTIVQISDLHIGPMVSERRLADALSRVSALRADLVVVTGDIIDFDPRYLPVAQRLLGRLSARHGVVCIPGNHDHYAGLGAVTAALEQAGLEVLVNRGRVIAPGDGGGFALLGVDDLWGRVHHTGPGPDLARARASVAPARGPEAATVLLAHQPGFFDEAVAAGGVDLQLSGHTHGGQINPGFVAAWPLLRPYVAGRYEREGHQLYVNRGFGTVGPPCRVGAPPEISRIVLVAG